MTPRSSIPFRSLRIIGKRAQSLLEKARQGARERKGKRVALPPPQEFEEVLVRFSIPSVIAAGFAILAIGIGVLAIAHLRGTLILLLLAIFVAVVIDPGVQRLQHWRVPRGLAVLIHYAAALFLFFFLVFSLVPILAKQVEEIAFLLSLHVDRFLADPQINLPLLSDEMNAQLTVLVQGALQDLSIAKFADAVQQLGQRLSSTAQESLRFAANVAGSVVNFLVSMAIVLVLAFFMQLEKERIVQWLRGFLPPRYRLYVDGKVDAIHSKIGQWARGQLLLCLSIFLLTFLALLILRMPYALTLAIFAGFCEFVPAVGPFMAAVPAVIIAATQGGIPWAAVVAVIYYIIQWCENNLLVPLIMNRAVGLSPIAILVAMLIGASFPETIHPVLGIMLAIPVTTVIALFLEDWRDPRDRDVQYR